MRLNGQVVHYKGLHDTYDVAPIAFTDSMTVADVAKVINLNPLYVDVMAFKDGYSEFQVQAETIEVLSTEGVQYATTDSLGIHDLFSESVIQAEAIEVLSNEGVQYATTDTITFADAAAKS